MDILELLKITNPEKYKEVTEHMARTNAEMAEKAKFNQMKLNPSVNHGGVSYKDILMQNIDAPEYKSDAGMLNDKEYANAKLNALLRKRQGK